MLLAVAVMLADKTTPDSTDTCPQEWVSKFRAHKVGKAQGVVSSVAPATLSSGGSSIREALSSLSVEHRSVISAAYYEGRSVADISARLRIPEGTVKSRLHYGLRTLRVALQEKGVTRP
jgi:RNA polymerase sigma-70 factor (ECF subfamily)